VGQTHQRNQEGPPLVVGPSASTQQSVSESGSVSDVSGVTNLTNLGHGNTSIFGRGIRYQLIPEFDESLSLLSHENSWTEVLLAFNSAWKCRFYGNSQPTKELVKYGPRGTTRTRRNGDRVLACVCSCQTNLDNPGQIHVLQLCFTRSTSKYHVKADRRVAELIKDHFVPKQSDPNSVPQSLVLQVESILNGDPFLPVHEVLLTLCAGQLPEVDFSQWLNQNLTRSYHLVVNVIKSKAEQIISQVSVNEGLDSVPLGNTLVHLTAFSRRHSIFNHSLGAMAPPSGVNGLVPFSSMADFMAEFGFSQKDTILTIPVDRSIFDGQPFTREQIDQAMASVIFLTPSHLWALHQIVHSPSHRGTLVWFLDGCFKFTRTRRGEGCLITQGFAHLDATISGNLVRSFVPVCHTLATSESGEATFASVRMLHRVLEEYVGFTHDGNPPVFVKDLSKGLQKGIKAAFPNSKTVACIEHVRAMVHRQGGQSLSPDAKSRMMYDIHLLHQCPSKTLEARLLDAVIAGWERSGLQRYSQAFVDHHVSPTSVNPVELRHCAVGIPGISNEIQCLENYFGRLTGSSRQQKPGIIKRNAGVRHFLKTGIHRLAAYDCNLCLAKDVGSWTTRYHHRIPTPVVIMRALLLDVADVRQVSQGHGGGFLVNRSSHIGREITGGLEMEYFLALNSSPLQPNQPPIQQEPVSPTILVEKVTSFCWVRTLASYMASLQQENSTSGQHLLSSNLAFVCNCDIFWAHLVCPSTLKVCDLQGTYPLSSVVQEHHRGRSSNNRTPGRRRARPPRRRPDHTLLLQHFGLPDNYRNEALIFIKESSVQQVEKVLKARRIMGVDRMSTKFDKIAFCVAGTHIGDDISRACVSRNHPFLDLHIRVLNQLRAGFRTNSRFVQPSHYSILSDPFPEGSDPAENSDCCSYFVRLDTEAPIAAGRVHPLGVSLCMNYAHRGGTTFFDDRMGPFPALEALSDVSLVAYRDACVEHDPMFSEEKPRIVFLEDRVNNFLSGVIPDFDSNFATEEVQFEVPDNADIDCVVEEVISPFTLLLSQKSTPDQTTVSAALLVGPVSLYLFRLWNPDGSHTEGTDSVYAVFRPKRIHYFSGGCPASAYTITVCTSIEALHGFLKRILDLSPAGSNLSRAVAPNGRVMARFYIGDKPTLCVSTDANYGLSTEVVASSNTAWHNNNQQSSQPAQTEEGEGNVAGTDESQEDEVAGSRQQQHTHQGNPTQLQPGEGGGSSNGQGHAEEEVPTVSEELMAEFARRQQIDDERFLEQEENQQLDGGGGGGGGGISRETNTTNTTNTTRIDDVAQPGFSGDTNDPGSANQGNLETSSTSSDSDVARNRTPVDRRVGWLSRLRHDPLLNSDSSDSDSSEGNNILRRTEQTGQGTPGNVSDNPLPTIVHRHPHRRFFEEHHSGTDGSWADYTVVPFFIDGVGADLGNDDEEEEEQEIARVTGEGVARTGSTCPFCLRDILETDDIAFSNRCPHIMHESCCRHWFRRVGFPSDSSEESTGGDALTELLPMGKCPECRVVGRWCCKHDNKWMPDGKPVYGIHQLFDAEMREYRRRRRGEEDRNLVPFRSQLSMVIHIHSSILYSAINMSYGYIHSVTELSREDMHVLASGRARLLHKLYLWSLFPNTFPCHRCKKKKPWASLYKWSNCDVWCHAVLCMDCSSISRNGPCSVCGKSGFLQDYSGSPFSRNTRQQRRPLHNPNLE
jgi:hypothetical protein